MEANKQIVANMRWTPEERAQLPMEDGFYMRGLETTRLDTLIDAAFAFVLTVLVIATDDIPSSFTELIVGIKQIPALATSFLVLMMFWLTHRHWSRSFGIETKASIVISVSLVFVLMIYIYPLRMLFEGMFHFISGGYFPFELNMTTEAQVRGFFAFYSLGFLIMCLLVASLYKLAINGRDTLCLSDYEAWNTYNLFIRWLVAAGFAVISLILSFTLPLNLIHWAGFIYFGVFIIRIVQDMFYKKYEPEI